jgi:outer membrane protein OmpA-like peptidoglycan-associated protein
LSEKRAKSVSSYFISQGVDASRLTTKWYGETQPKFANDDASRAKNRRVELGIYANDDMKEDAKSKRLN